MEPRRVEHPDLGLGTLLKTYMGGYEWEVAFASGRRFRLPAREFEQESVDTWQREYDRPGMTPLPEREPILSEDQLRARFSLEALRFGIVPVQDVETLTIGLEAEGVSLNRALARSKERGGDVMAVIGDYGFGKSHFVELAARRALRDNFIVMDAGLDLVEVPPGKPYNIYRSLAASTRYPDSNERGLQFLLENAAGQPALVENLSAMSPLQEHCPLSVALIALGECSNQTTYDDILQWITGRALQKKILKPCIKKPPSLYRIGDTARQYTYLLTGISRLAKLSGYSGLAVLLDESEHYSLLRAKQRDRADSFFTAMISAALGRSQSRIDPESIPQHYLADYPLVFAESPYLFFLFALTESESRMPIDEWLAPSQLVRLDDRFIEKDVHKFLRTLQDYHGLAYDYSPNGEGYTDIMMTVPGMLSRTLAQHRINLRELIRIAVAIYDLLYLHEDYASATALQELADGLGL
ncbi:MAG: DUF2791 family P-loop domain-containing protein [Anaerolineae bacterium]|nr:DUF2791 family P-loop domain-containing protein [Anaerolineae bacterium]